MDEVAVTGDHEEVLIELVLRPTNMHEAVLKASVSISKPSFVHGIVDLAMLPMAGIRHDLTALIAPIIVASPRRQSSSPSVLGLGDYQVGHVGQPPFFLYQLAIASLSRRQV